MSRRGRTATTAARCLLPALISRLHSLGAASRSSPWTVTIPASVVSSTETLTLGANRPLTHDGGRPAAARSGALLPNDETPGRAPAAGAAGAALAHSFGWMFWLTRNVLSGS